MIGGIPLTEYQPRREPYNAVMLGRMFVAVSELPGMKKKLWRALYGYLGSQRVSDWKFMNYGYVPAGPQTLALDGADEPDRFCIQLYDHVAGAVDLRARTVLEVGSGRGGGASYVRRYMHPARMVGVDLARNAVEFCRAAHQVKGLEFKVGDAENLPFAGSSFDAVVNVESSHCYPSMEKFLAEVRRVLRPGGHFLYADFRDSANLELWRATLRASGLLLVKETDITSNVLAALERDNDRKVDSIRRLIPALLRRSFFDFAAVRGSALFEGFQSGRLIYTSFVLRKKSDDA
jgi:SAM-dependent methyltransferase